MWTSPCPPTTTKFLINSHHPKMCLKIWVFRGNPSVAFKNCWKVSQEGEKLGSLLNPNFLLPHLNLLIALLSYPHPPGLSKLIPRGEGNQRVRRQWSLKDLVSSTKKRFTGHQSSRELAMPPAEGQKWVIFNCPSPKHGFQLPCLVVSP